MLFRSAVRDHARGLGGVAEAAVDDHRRLGVPLGESGERVPRSEHLGRGVVLRDVDERRAGLVEQVRNGHRRVVGLLLLGIVPLLAGHLLPLLLGKHRADGPIFGDLDWLVDNVLVIAAWVFVWEAVTTLVLTRRDLATSVGRIDRIVAADLVFRAERARSA